MPFNQPYETIFKCSIKIIEMKVMVFIMSAGVAEDLVLEPSVKNFPSM